MPDRREPPGEEGPIQRLASRMQGIMLGGRLLTRKQAETRIEAWIENFRPFGVDAGQVITALDHTEMLYDDQILDRCVDILTPQHEEVLDGDRVFYAPLGDARESSARVMRGYNHMKGWAPDLPTLLSEPRIHRIDRPVIVFVDDFLNSGGQFRAILETWAGARPMDSVGAMFSSGRRPLSAQGRRLMGRARLLFVFRYAMEQGRAQADAVLSELGWNGAVRCVNTFDDHVGIFGTAGDLQGIRQGSADAISNDAKIFRGWPCHTLSRFLAVCEEAGEALLRLNKPTWSEARYRERRLGYGNSAKLFLTQYNVPTCTLTCVWAGGVIEVLGQRVNWRPLVPRREKGLGGRETIGDRSAGGIAPGDLPLAEVLRTHFLDRRRGATSPLEVVVWAPLPAPLDRSPPAPWELIPVAADQGPRAFTGLLRPETRAAIGFRAGGGAAAWSLPAARLGPINNHLVLALDDNHHPVKVQAATCFSFPGATGAVALRLRFSPGPMDLMTAGMIAHALSQGSPRRGGPVATLLQRSPRGDGGVPETDLARLLAWVEGSARGDAESAPDPFTPTVEGSIALPLQMFVFVRETGELWQPRDGRLDRALNALTSFARPDRARAARVTAHASLALDVDAVVGLSERGAVWLCGGTHGINHGFAVDHFCGSYLLLHVFAHAVAASCRSVLTSADPCPEQLAWLRRLIGFPWADACTKPRMNRFLDELARMLNLDGTLARVDGLQSRP